MAFTAAVIGGTLAYAGVSGEVVDVPISASTRSHPLAGPIEGVPIAEGVAESGEVDRAPCLFRDSVS
jgi:hypothetical protein